MSEDSVIRREKTELLVGLFILVGMVIMGALIWQFGKITDRMGERYQLSLRLADASGIIEGSSVRFGGTKIGFVQKKDPRQDFSGIILTLDMDSNYLIPKGSKFMVTTSGLMGDRYISVSPPGTPTEEKIEPGSVVEGFLDDPVKEIQASVMDLSTRANVVLAELDQAITDSQVVVSNFTQISEKLNEEVLSDDNLDNLANALDKISLTTDNMNKASAKLDPLIEESRVTVKQAGKPFETADKSMVELEPTIKELRETVERADEAIRQMTSGSGVTASLINNPQLARDVESLVANLEEHGILGYKKGKQKDDAMGQKVVERRPEKPAAPPQKMMPVSAEGTAKEKEESKPGWFQSLTRPSSSSQGRSTGTANRKPFTQGRR